MLNLMAFVGSGVRFRRKYKLEVFLQNLERSDAVT